LRAQGVDHWLCCEKQRFASAVIVRFPRKQPPCLSAVQRCCQAGRARIVRRPKNEVTLKRHSNIEHNATVTKTSHRKDATEGLKHGDEPSRKRKGSSYNCLGNEADVSNLKAQPSRTKISTSIECIALKHTDIPYNQDYHTVLIYNCHYCEVHYVLKI